MAEKGQTTAKKGGSSPGTNGRGSRANGRKPKANGRKPKANGKGRRVNGGGGNGVAGIDDLRRVATEMGNAMLVATSVETARHSDDVELISGAICEKLGVSEPKRADVLAAARLHDIGKASMPRKILEKPGPLSDEEWDLMREHTVTGEQILASVGELEEIASLVRHSHERWDGKGYPDGLSGDQIPLGSRIIFCADAFHAVRSDRPYRKGRSADQALAEVRRCAGSQFDPRVAAALEEVVRELRLASPVRRSRRSSRLTALLLVLALGGAGSAVGRSNLLGDPDPAAPGAAPPAAIANPFGCQSLDCYSWFGPVLLRQLRALNLVHAAPPLGLHGGVGAKPLGSTGSSTASDSILIGSTDGGSLGEGSGSGFDDGSGGGGSGDGGSSGDGGASGEGGGGNPPSGGGRGHGKVRGKGHGKVRGNGHGKGRGNGHGKGKGSGRGGGGGGAGGDSGGGHGGGSGGGGHGGDK